MDKELKITEARVKEAAESCGTAKEVLKKLFPEVFGCEWEDITKNIRIESNGDELVITDGTWYYYGIKEGSIRTCKGLGNDVKIEYGRVYRRPK